MNIENAINQFYYDLTISELKNMSNTHLYSKITYNSLLYLDIIAYTENCTASMIADMLNISKSAVTIKLNELLEQGLILKTPSKEDKRISYITVIESAKEQYKIYDYQINSAIIELKKVYPKEDIEKFCEMLKIICKSFCATLNLKD